ncbi:hypothetical protein M9458_040862, partial [Cirrhinus mrigala]
MDLASINIVPRRGNTILEGFTIFIFQNGRDLEDYVEEFVNTCHRASCDNVCLMKGFRCGLDDDLRFVMPRGDPCWTLQSYINFALWTNGSMFTLDEAEEDTKLVQPHFADVSQHDPEPSQPPPRLAEPEPEPTADGESEPRVTVSSPRGATAQKIATKPEPSLSDQVQLPALNNMPAWISHPPSLCYLLLLALLPHPAAHPQSTICAVGPPRVCQSPSASWLEDPFPGLSLGPST